MTDASNTPSHVHVGMPLPVLVKTPSNAMLFRFSAVTWNAHRIHYDESYARHEGHEGVLVQATMHGAFLLQMVTQFAGPGGHIVELNYSNRGKALAGDTLTLGGSITEINYTTGLIDCDIWERNQNHQLCAIGTACLYMAR